MNRPSRNCLPTAVPVGIFTQQRLIRYQAIEDGVTQVSFLFRRALIAWLVLPILQPQPGSYSSR